MLGCASLAAASTSRWNRSTAPACFMAAEERTLIATRRSIRRCWAFKHHAHAAFAQLVQHDVFAEDQPLGLALVDGLGLVLGQLAVLDEGLGELLDILGPLVGREAVLERGDFGRRHQPALGQPLDELLDRDRHRPDPRPDHWVAPTLVVPPLGGMPPQGGTTSGRFTTLAPGPEEPRFSTIPRRRQG